MIDKRAARAGHKSADDRNDEWIRRTIKDPLCYTTSAHTSRRLISKHNKSKSNGIKNTRFVYNFGTKRVFVNRNRHHNVTPKIINHRRGEISLVCEGSR